MRYRDHAIWLSYVVGQFLHSFAIEFSDFRTKDKIAGRKLRKRTNKFMMKTICSHWSYVSQPNTFKEIPAASRSIILLRSATRFSCAFGIGDDDGAIQGDGGAGDGLPAVADELVKG